jgi:hypothetical protein
LQPEKATAPCHRFFRDNSQLMSFVSYITTTATSADEMRRTAAEALAEGERLAGGDPSKYTLDKETMALAALRRHAQLLLQLAYSRAVDNYLAFLSELLRLLYSERPETLRARLDEGRRGAGTEAVPLELVLEHSTMDDLIGSLVERRVTELSFKGVGTLADYLAARLKFDLFCDESHLRRVVKIVELRNLIVHNRAVVNRLYKQRVPESDYPLGHAIVLDVSEFGADLLFAAESVVDIDERAVQKWSLPTISKSLEP